MSQDCPTCKSSIINQQASLIGNPKCVDECPTDVGCEVSPFTQCVIYNGAVLTCLDVTAGMTLNQVLLKLETACNNVTTTCRTKIDATDTCCGYLTDKIQSDSLTITVEDGSVVNCKHLQIEETCWTFTNIAPQCSGTGCFRNQWLNAGGQNQVAQYSNVKECVVKLRGSVANFFSDTCIFSLITVLPVGRRPLFNRTFTANVVVNNLFTPATDCNVFPGVIEVLNNGNVALKFDNRPTAGYHPFFGVVSLDGIEFEIN